MKKIACILLIAAMLAGFAAGCGSGGQGGGAAVTQAVAATEVDAADAAGANEADAAAAETTVKTADNAASAINGSDGEKVTLRILAFIGQGQFPEGSDENHNFLVDFLKEKTPYDYEFTFVDNGADGRNALIAAGNIYDMVKLTNSKELLTLVRQDYIAPIDDILPAMKELMNPAQISTALWNIARVDGKTYGVPQEWSDPYVGFAMRVDWLKNMGLNPPVSLDDFTGILRAFKNNDPNGDGANVIPFTACWGMGTALEFFRGVYGIHLEYMPIDGKITFVYATEKGKDMIAYMADLYTEGLMDPEIAVMNEEIIGQRLFTGQVGSAYIPWWTMKNWDTVFRDDMGFVESPFWWVAPPNGPDGKPSKLKEYGPIEHIMVYPKLGHVREAVDFSNRLLDPEIADMLQFGIQGVHWDKDESGNRYLTDAYNDIVWRWHYGDNLGYRLDFMQAQINLEYGPWREPVQQWKGGVATSTLLIPAIPDIDEIQANVGDYFTNEIAKFVMGERPMGEYDAFIDELKNLGLDEIVAKTQIAYDAVK